MPLLDLTRKHSIRNRVAQDEVIQFLELFNSNIVIHQSPEIYNEDRPQLFITTISVENSFVDEFTQFFIAIHCLNNLFVDQSLGFKYLRIDLLMVIAHRVQEPEVVVVVISKARRHVQFLLRDPVAKFEDLLLLILSQRDARVLIVNVAAIIDCEVEVFLCRGVGSDSIVHDDVRNRVSQRCLSVPFEWASFCISTHVKTSHRQINRCDVSMGQISEDLRVKPRRTLLVLDVEPV